MAEGTKSCRGCGRVLALDQFNRLAKAKDGLQPRCRRCASDYHRERNARNPGANRARAKAWREANPERVKETKRRWHAENYERIAARQRRWESENHEAVREAARRWRARNRDHVLRYQRAQRMANWDRARDSERRWAAANPEKVAARRRRWAELNPDRLAELNRNSRHARRVTILRKRRDRYAATTAVARFTIDELRARLSMFGDLCWMCGAPAVEVDHVKPIAKGGSHMLCNLRPACRSCNGKKRDRWPVDTSVHFLVSHGPLSLGT